MAATIAGSLKALVESAGLSLQAFRDEAPAGTPLPYVTITEVTAPPILSGDFGDPVNGQPTLAVLAQVDLWQARRDPATGAVAERYGLAAALSRALHGRVPPSVLGGRVSPLKVLTANRNPTGAGENIVRDTLDVLAHVDPPTEEP